MKRDFFLYILKEKQSNASDSKQSLLTSFLGGNIIKLRTYEE